MKNVNRTLLLSLLGVAAATPFVVIAFVVGVKATALADSLQGGLLYVVLALASLVASMGEGRIGLRSEGAPTKRNRVELENKPDVRGVSTLNHGY